MRYYVQADHSISFFKNKDKAIEFATNVAKEKDIHYVAFSTCKESVPVGLPEDTLEKELYKAMFINLEIRIKET